MKKFYLWIIPLLVLSACDKPEKPNDHKDDSVPTIIQEK